MFMEEIDLGSLAECNICFEDAFDSLCLLSRWTIFVLVVVITSRE